MSEVKKILPREEMDEAFTWATEDLFESDEAWEKEMTKGMEVCALISRHKGKLAASGEELLSMFKDSEEVDIWFDVVSAYAMRKGDQDTTNSKYQGYVSQMMDLYSKLIEAQAYVEPEIMAIDDDTLEEFYKSTQGLEHFRRAINDTRRRKAHVLSENEENIMAAASEMLRSPNQIYGRFSDADLKFPDAIDKNGVSHPVTHGSFVPLCESRDRVLRESAYKSLYSTYRAFENTSASLLASQISALKFNAKCRHYENTLEAALDETNVPVSVYKNLIKAVHENMDKMHKYVSLRKKLLGVEELHFYDVYTPMVASKEEVIPFEEAKDTILKALQPLGEEYCTVLKSGLENRWIDVYENRGKRSGAYSSGCRVHPYVLLNYAGTLDSMFTLAHEMGHAMHSYYSLKTQSPTYSNYKIFVAEVASTCNEALLMQYLLKTTTEPARRITLINKFLEQFKSTLYRQTMFAEFELIINEMSERGEALTAATLCEKYGQLQEQNFGPEMIIDDEIKHEWCRIPHFFYNYYVFQYATGYSAAMALSKKVLEGGNEDLEHYLNFLKGGCSTDPISLLKGAGVDMNSTSPITDALNLFGELIDEMDTLTK